MFRAKRSVMVGLDGLAAGEVQGEMSMLRPGLVSITFRTLSPRNIAQLCAQNGLEGVEWGGDVHVPHGDVAKAEEVAAITRDTALDVAAYGSYYRCDGDKSVAFGAVLDSAVALGAPLIRVWAGPCGSDAAGGAGRAAVAKDLNRICDLAGAAGIRIGLEYHGGTLTDTRASCRALLDAVPHPNLSTLWQPLRRVHGDARVTENLADLEDVTGRLSNVHVYNWVMSPTEQTLREPLAGGTQWNAYFDVLGRLTGTHWLLLEFLPEDSVERLPGEAEVLRSWIDKI